MPVAHLGPVGSADQRLIRTLRSAHALPGASSPEETWPEWTELRRAVHELAQVARRSGQPITAAIVELKQVIRSVDSRASWTAGRVAEQTVSWFIDGYYASASPSTGV